MKQTEKSTLPERPHRQDRGIHADQGMDRFSNGWRNPAAERSNERPQ